MSVFWEGDVPAEDLLIAPARGPGDYIDLDPFNDVDLTLRDPAGEFIEAAGDLLAEIVDDEGEKVVKIEWPETSPFTAGGGIYNLGITLLGDDGVRQRCAPERLFIQADDGWYSVEEARADWRGAPVDDSSTFRALAGARLDVVTWDAEDTEDPDYDPTARPALNLREAQLAQARNRWNAYLVDPNGQGGEDALSYRPFPLDWYVKQIIRPASPIPVFF